MVLLLVSIGDIDNSGVRLNINDEGIVSFSKSLNRCEFKVVDGKVFMQQVRIGAQVWWRSGWEEVRDLNKGVEELTGGK